MTFRRDFRRHNFFAQNVQVSFETVYLWSELESRKKQALAVLQSWLLLLIDFLADRTNGRAYATVLHPPVCRLRRYVLWLNGAS